MTEQRSRVAEAWGSWEDADRWRREAFRNRSPLDRLAWLEDLLRLRLAVEAGKAQRKDQAS